MAENDASFGSKLITDTPDFDSVINNLPMNEREVYPVNWTAMWVE